MVSTHQEHALDFGSQSLPGFDRQDIAHQPLLTSFCELKGKRVAVFGGTFDPVTLGHIGAARAALEKHGFDALVFVPAQQNPLKEKAPGASGPQRVEMIIRAIGNDTRMRVSPLELEFDRPSYTADTLDRIWSELEQDGEVFLVLGADNIKQFPVWHKNERILELAKIVAINRDNKLEDSITEAKGCLSDDVIDGIRERSVDFDHSVSATEVRTRAQSGESLDGLIDPEVSKFIEERRLYIGGQNDE